MNTTKPYLIRAIYEWCVDNSYTPHVVVSVNSDTQVPMEYVEKGEIILNIGNNATNDLIMGNDSIQFVTRFNGAPKKLQIPINAIKGIFAKEVNQGLTFPLESELQNKLDNDQPVIKQKKNNKSREKKPHLQVVK